MFTKPTILKTSIAVLRNRPETAANNRPAPAPVQPSHPQYRQDIDGIRAIAVLSVVGFHSFPNLIKSGFVGVDIFFVISGFLISTILFRSLENNQFSFMEFYSRRIRRIFPALIIVIITSLALGWFFLLADEYQQLGKHVAGGATFISNFILWNESGYFDNVAETKPLLHLWSLGIEEQFYLAYPFILWLAWKRRLQLFSIILIIALISFFLNIIQQKVDPIADFYSPLTRFWELMAGSLLAYQHKWNFHKSEHTLYNDLISAIGVIFLIVSFFIITKEKTFPGWWALLPTTGTVLLLSAGPQALLNIKILSSRPLVLLGLISYPLYLWHWVLLSFARILENEVPSVEIRIFAVLLSIVLAWGSYKFIEKPVRFGKHNKAKTIILVLLMVLAGLIGYHIFFYNGYVSRKANQFSFSIDSSINTFAAMLQTRPNYISEIQTDRQVAIRSPYCHMNLDNQTFSEYQQGIAACLSFSESKPNVLIIGDSHAADLFVALSHSMSSQYNFLQATGAGCSPDKNYGERCSELIRYAVEFAKNNPVDAIILANRWFEPDYGNLLKLVNEIRSFNNNIYLISPPASFTADVSKIIQRGSIRRNEQQISLQYLDREGISENMRLHEFAKTNNIQYIDRIKLFCGEELICPLISPDGELYIWDYGHLGRIGSYYLGEQFVKGNVSF